MKRDLVSILDVEEDLTDILELAVKLKKRQREGNPYMPFTGKTLGMIFEKPSLRTRVSFELAFKQLGGDAIYLSPAEIGIGKRESTYDVAMVLSRYVDILEYRAFEHRNVADLAEFATVPVINGLDDLEHPCQTAADLLTIVEHKGELEGRKFVYVGDGNNVCNSLMLGCAITGMDMIAACPANKKYLPDDGILARAKEIAQRSGCTVEISHSPQEAVRDADVIYTDTWVSMGDEKEKMQRLLDFQGFQVNEALVKKARRNYIFMHCLPAHRGDEVTDEVIDSPNSVVFDEAENRLHAQKAIMVRALQEDWRTLL